ncbi:MAG: hypothetical protein HUU01_01175 [Saprospiraceae bacterium]|nr:hypothetical protein [Saprospiraceae bacterium]
MANPLIPQYTFLPWLRRGIIGLAQSVPAKERLSVSLTLNVRGEGAQSETKTVQRKAELLGPADVGGLNAQAIVRTVPRAGTRDFESNFLAAIEFYDEDLVWRYSPALPGNNRLKPWIWLVALTETEYKRQGISDGKLPVIEITPQALRDAFPDPDSAAAWAHVHLNFGVPASVTQAKDAHLFVQGILDENPNLGCSRLICPRRLKPDTSYTVFLVPAYEKGRLAGLGFTEKQIDETPNAQASWPKKAAVTGALSFPVYYEWSFTTSNTGDFENLARLLKPVDAKALLGGGRLLDIQNPGWGQQYQSQAPGRQQAGAIVLESVLRIPASPGPDAPKDPQENLYFGKDTVADTKFSSDLALLLNLGAEPLTQGVTHIQEPFFPDGSIEDDPFVVPPLYGSFYKNEKKIGTTMDWYKQLNTNPMYRIAAGNGTAVIQEHQETYMNHAWDQLASLAETSGATRRWQFSLHLSEAFYSKRLKEPLNRGKNVGTKPDPEKTAQLSRMINLFAPMHGSLKSGQGNFVNTLTDNAFASTYTRAFNKITRTGGPLMRRFKDKPSLNPVYIPPPKPPDLDFYLKKAVTEAIGYLANPQFPPTFPPKSKAESKKDFEEALQKKGLVGISALIEAFSGYSNLPEELRFFSRLPQNDDLYVEIAGQVRPSKTIPARMRAVMVLQAPASAADAEKIEFQRQTVEFPEPMYARLAARDPHLILPSLDRIPLNSVTVMEPNPAVIESYLIGLNHEMAREFLWREFPANLNDTFFRQFWDVRNNASANVQPENYKDILPVGKWAPGTLGAPQHRPGGAPAGISVIVIRGDLLRKYPNTLVFVQKAKWKNSAQRKERIPGDEIKMPIFSGQIAPDYVLLGFDVSPADLKGNKNKSSEPGWFFGLKERVGEAHFGLDMSADGDPAWPLIPEVLENQCIHVESANFKKLPGFTSTQADRVAALLFQKPFLLLVHASQLLS